MCVGWGRAQSSQESLPNITDGSLCECYVSAVLKLNKFIHHQLSYCFGQQELTVSLDSKDSSPWLPVMA